MKTLFYFIAFMTCGTLLFAQETINLYPDKIPNEIPGPDNEKKSVDGVVRISNISRPTLSVYLPDKSVATGTAVVICPGGGYGINAIQHEGYDVALELNKAGATDGTWRHCMRHDRESWK
jgi:hypothetical protein